MKKPLARLIHFLLPLIAITCASVQATAPADTPTQRERGLFESEEVFQYLQERESDLLQVLDKSEKEGLGGLNTQDAITSFQVHLVFQAINGEKKRRKARIKHPICKMVQAVFHKDRKSLFQENPLLCKELAPEYSVTSSHYIPWLIDPLTKPIPNTKPIPKWRLQDCWPALSKRAAPSLPAIRSQYTRWLQSVITNPTRPDPYPNPYEIEIELTKQLSALQEMRRRRKFEKRKIHVLKVQAEISEFLQPYDEWKGSGYLDLEVFGKVTSQKIASYTLVQKLDALLVLFDAHQLFSETAPSHYARATCWSARELRRHIFEANVAFFMQYQNLLTQYGHLVQGHKPAFQAPKCLNYIHPAGAGATLCTGVAGYIWSAWEKSYHANCEYQRSSGLHKKYRQASEEAEACKKKLEACKEAYDTAQANWSAKQKEEDGLLTTRDESYKQYKQAKEKLDECGSSAVGHGVAGLAVEAVGVIIGSGPFAPFLVGGGAIYSTVSVILGLSKCSDLEQEVDKWDEISKKDIAAWEKAEKATSAAKEVAEAAKEAFEAAQSSHSDALSNRGEEQLPPKEPETVWEILWKPTYNLPSVHVGTALTFSTMLCEGVSFAPLCIRNYSAFHSIFPVPNLSFEALASALERHQATYEVLQDLCLSMEEFLESVEAETATLQELSENRSGFQWYIDCYQKDLKYIEDNIRDKTCLISGENFSVPPFSEATYELFQVLRIHYQACRTQKLISDPQITPRPDELLVLVFEADKKFMRQRQHPPHQVIDYIKSFQRDITWLQDYPMAIPQDFYDAVAQEDRSYDIVRSIHGIYEAGSEKYIAWIEQYQQSKAPRQHFLDHALYQGNCQVKILQRWHHFLSIEEKKPQRFASYLSRSLGTLIPYWRPAWAQDHPYFFSGGFTLFKISSRHYLTQPNPGKDILKKLCTRENVAEVASDGLLAFLNNYPPIAKVQGQLLYSCEESIERFVTYLGGRYCHPMVPKVIGSVLPQVGYGSLVQGAQMCVGVIVDRGFRLFEKPREKEDLRKNIKGNPCSMEVCLRTLSTELCKSSLDEAARWLVTPTFAGDLQAQCARAFLGGFCSITQYCVQIGDANFRNLGVAFGVGGINTLYMGHIISRHQADIAQDRNHWQAWGDQIYSGRPDDTIPAIAKRIGAEGTRKALHRTEAIQREYDRLDFLQKLWYGPAKYGNRQEAAETEVAQQTVGDCYEKINRQIAYFNQHQACYQKVFTSVDQPRYSLARYETDRYEANTFMKLFWDWAFYNYDQYHDIDYSQVDLASISTTFSQSVGVAFSATQQEMWEKSLENFASKVATAQEEQQRDVDKMQCQEGLTRLLQHHSKDDVKEYLEEQGYTEETLRKLADAVRQDNDKAPAAYLYDLLYTERYDNPAPVDGAFFPVPVEGVKSMCILRGSLLQEFLVAPFEVSAFLFSTAKDIVLPQAKSSLDQLLKTEKDVISLEVCCDILSNEDYFLIPQAQRLAGHTLVTTIKASMQKHASKLSRHEAGKTKRILARIRDASGLKVYEEHPLRVAIHAGVDAAPGLFKFAGVNGARAALVTCMLPGAPVLIVTGVSSVLGFTAKKIGEKCLPKSIQENIVYDTLVNTDTHAEGVLGVGEQALEIGNTWHIMEGHEQRELSAKVAGGLAAARFIIPLEGKIRRMSPKWLARWKSGRGKACKLKGPKTKSPAQNLAEGKTRSMPSSRPASLKSGRGKAYELKGPKTKSPAQNLAEGKIRRMPSSRPASLKSGRGKAYELKGPKTKSPAQNPWNEFAKGKKFGSHPKRQQAYKKSGKQKSKARRSARRGKAKSRKAARKATRKAARKAKKKAKKRGEPAQLKQGREIHERYKTDLQSEAKKLTKECREVPGVRPDFVDLKNQIIYELKPGNPRGIKAGKKQLRRYREAYQAEIGGDWELVLDLYGKDGKIWTAWTEKS